MAVSTGNISDALWERYARQSTRLFTEHPGKAVSESMQEGRPNPIEIFHRAVEAFKAAVRADDPLAAENAVKSIEDIASNLEA